MNKYKELVDRAYVVTNELEDIKNELSPLVNDWLTKVEKVRIHKINTWVSIQEFGETYVNIKVSSSSYGCPDDDYFNIPVEYFSDPEKVIAQTISNRNADERARQAKIALQRENEEKALLERLSRKYPQSSINS